MNNKAEGIQTSNCNQQNVYYYKCGLCDIDYVGFTSRHLHQRVEEHKRSTIGYHVKDEHGEDPDSIESNLAA